eukprot:TRINITY_DN45783_c0_g1_i1.p1 TRINITY_DN45783_c0_g1~~TRINITY_DN45783_c0_g1_i1.p1  ORF type:complete len:118 (-),score=23.29 TRINITY_DN45783_c0_g1_i1:9-362(-)
MNRADLAVVADGYWYATLGPLLLLKPPQLMMFLGPVPVPMVRPLGLVTTAWGTLLVNEQFHATVGHKEVATVACGSNACAATALAALAAKSRNKIFLGALSAQMAAFSAWQFAALRS